MSRLPQVVLFARSAREVSALELEVFLEESRDRAVDLEVTGSLMLLHSGARPTAFVQWLEGPSGAVRDLEDEFSNQPFLDSSRTLVRAHPQSRVYASWGVTRRLATDRQIVKALERFPPEQ
ncbi:BLUF domain-containing protein [Rubrivirga sp.]|uniref:BLUF domain-containing protein n=1 Tax=Rubrivirga sp. TaxID=1885344 RepID=UPI003C7395DE